ncbi:TRAP transporter substrate-binding protein [Castellaniella sp. GW247-6E4]|uniref:TRAP transporter substrate-binding protein n=1 Tax=Castellaniella sp. GW247-6E4 TaxID=3140380 RepID=UPI0033163CC0
MKGDKQSCGPEDGASRARQLLQPGRRSLLRLGVSGGMLAGAGILPGVIGSAWAQGGKTPEFKLKFGHPYNVKHPLAKGAEKFAGLLAERTGGAVQVDVYPNSTIGSSQALVNGMQMGAVDIALVPTTDVATFYDPLDVFYLPFIFSDSAHAYRFADGAAAKGLYEEMRSRTGIRYLAMMESGFRTITTRATAVRAPDDLKGLKMRVPNNPINIATFRALGANATSMALSEVFTALQQGTVDGQDNPIGNVYSFGFYKVQGYETLSNHQWAGIMFLISDAKFAALPADVQKVVAEAAKESQDWERAELQRENGNYLDLMRKEGLQVIDLNDDERARFRAKTKTVVEEFGKGLSRELIDSAVKA